MAEPARKIVSSGAIPSSAPANTNASSLGGASLRVLQGGRSQVVRKDRNQPTLHPLSQLEMARQLQEGQMRDRMSMGDDTEVSDDTLKAASDSEEGGSVLDLEPRSYVNREETPAQTELNRQRKMAQVGARFGARLNAGAAMNEDIPQTEERQSPQRQPSAAERRSQSESQAQDQFSRSIQSKRQQLAIQEQRKSEERAVSSAAISVEDKAEEIRRFRQLMVKLVEISSVIMAIWVWIALNIETMNILLFRKKLPRALNSKLNAIGLNIDVDPSHPFSAMNLLIVGLTVTVNILLLLSVTMSVILMIFVFYWIIQAMDALSFLGIGF